jgi:hypothetical protein
MPTANRQSTRQDLIQHMPICCMSRTWSIDGHCHCSHQRTGSIQWICTSIYCASSAQQRGQTLGLD